MAASLDSSAYVRWLPSVAITMPPLATSDDTVAPRAVAAASKRARLAIGAATRKGVNIDCIVFGAAGYLAEDRLERDSYVLDGHRQLLGDARGECHGRSTNAPVDDAL